MPYDLTLKKVRGFLNHCLICNDFISESTKFKAQVTIFKNGLKNFKTFFCKGYVDIKPSGLIVRKKLSYFRSSYTFLNTLILANNLFIKSTTRSFIKLNTMTENENKSYTYTSTFSQERDQNSSITFVFVFYYSL